MDMIDLIENLYKDLNMMLWFEGPAARRPPYKVYMLARAIADFHGNFLSCI